MKRVALAMLALAAVAAIPDAAADQGDVGGSVRSSSPSSSSSSTTTTLSPRIVQTQYGALRGIIDRFGGNGIGVHPVEKFLGVPYATPPVNGLRFMPPITPSPWDGVKTAAARAPQCPQPPSLSAKYHADQRNATASEDCLYLNVFYPTFDGVFSTEKPPVVLLVEASSWESSAANWIDGSALASRGRLMVASVNFRLGILGFLKTSPKDSPQGNYGMLDVIAAVHWLRQNAAAFGGDPGRLTLIGIGHGASLVHFLMLSPVARGLFQGAILLGGSALGPAGVQSHPEDVRQQVARSAGCWDPDADGAENAERYDLAPCLRKLALDKLLDAGKLRTPTFLAAYAPFVDYGGQRAFHDPAAFLRDLTRLKNEAFPKCDLMVGVATYELERDLGLVSEEKRDSVLRTLVRNVYYYHNSEIFAVLRNEYTDWEVGSRNNTEAVTHSLHEALSDGLVASPLMELLRYHAGLGAGRTFLYHLNYGPAGGAAAAGQSHAEAAAKVAPSSGSFRADNVYYLLGLPLLADFRSSASATTARQLAEEVELAEQLVSYVAGFCYAGDPNEHGATEKNNNGKSNSGLIYWDQYTLAEQRYLSLGVKSRIRTHYRSHKMSVWLRLIPQLHQPGEEGVVLSHHYFRPNNQRDPPVFDEDYFDGVVRPYGEPKTRMPGRTTPATPDDGGADEAGDNKTNEENNGGKRAYQTSTECPTQQPYVATQLSNNQQHGHHNNSSLRSNHGIGITNNHNNNHHNNNNNNNVVNPRAHDDPWPYTQMLVVVVATGVTLLFLNAVVVVCFFVMRRRSASASAPDASNHRVMLYENRRHRYAIEQHAEHCPVNHQHHNNTNSKMAANRVESVSSIIDLTSGAAPVAPCEHEQQQQQQQHQPAAQRQLHSPVMCNNKVDSAIELFDCYPAYDASERLSTHRQSFSANDNEITV